MPASGLSEYGNNYNTSLREHIPLGDVRVGLNSINALPLSLSEDICPRTNESRSSFYTAQQPGDHETTRSPVPPPGLLSNAGLPRSPIERGPLPVPAAETYPTHQEPDDSEATESLNPPTQASSNAASLPLPIERALSTAHASESSPPHSGRLATIFTTALDTLSGVNTPSTSSSGAQSGTVKATLIVSKIIKVLGPGVATSLIIAIAIVTYKATVDQSCNQCSQLPPHALTLNGRNHPESADWLVEGFIRGVAAVESSCSTSAAVRSPFLCA